MGDQVRVVLDPAVGVSAAQFAAGWDADPDTSGGAAVAPAPAGVFLPGVLELVVVPLVVNLAASGLYDLIRQIVIRTRDHQQRNATTSAPTTTSRPREVSELEVRDVTTANGDRLLVVRWRQERS